ncbi:MAG TPA: hypothetical protein P5107_02600 [Thermotogota bacterium]|nr:hypothetical protein [Thermotogota bacterium]HRW33928.1 hypothetical protein [Thermotogota bacterium]
MKKLLVIILCMTIAGIHLAYTIEQVLQGVEKTTYEEFAIPYFKWISSVDGEFATGYDPFGQQGLLGVKANIRMFEKLDLSTSFAVMTDFASDMTYRFSLGLSYDFLRQSDSEKRYREANKEIIIRKLMAIELFFDYLKKKVMLNSQDQDVLSLTLMKLEQVDMAYNAIKIEALASISEGEPQIAGLSDYIPKKIDDDIVQTAVIRYLNLFSSQKGEEEHHSLFALFRTDYNAYLQGISAGLGGTYDFAEPVKSVVSDKIDEIDIRKNKLIHDVLTEVLPGLKEEYQRLEKEINSATSKIINGQLTKEAFNHMQETFEALENKYIELTLDAVKIEYLFTVLSGINVR